MYQMDLKLSTLSRDNRKRLLKMVEREMLTVHHPCGNCGDYTGSCNTCPHDEYCRYLTTMYVKIEKGLTV